MHNSPTIYTEHYRLDTRVALDWSEEGEAPPLVVVGNIYMLSHKVQ